MRITFRHAGAGSGKTFSIEQDIGSRLERGEIRPDQLIAVTFTRKAAAELAERIGSGLLHRGRPELAAALSQARIGTVHGVCGQLLEDFAFELGLSPRQRVIDDRDKTLLLKEGLDTSLSSSQTQHLNALASRLGVEDWQAAVLDIVEQARMNRFGTSDLARFAAASVQELLALLPAEDPVVDDSGLRHVLTIALPRVESAQKPTQKLLKSKETIENLLRKPELTWEDWVRVAKLDAGVKEADILTEAREYAAKVLQASRFRSDLEAFIDGMFAAAKSVLSEFARLKEQRGLVDFVDQERLTLDALDDPAVLARLRAQLAYLVVDEFQDTSPIQLALFTRLAALSDEVLFVGDAKQAIYGFRGSDPRLALDVIRYIKSGGGTLDNLRHSWRSRPGLVHLVNALFVHPFSTLLSEDQVRLKPKTDPPLSTRELVCWRLHESNQGKRAAALAAGLMQTVESGQQVWDNVKQDVRAAEWRDLAVLCRSNDDAATIANACIQQGVPVSLARIGLLETPEVSLALACLRRLADPNDTLASAEILALESGTNGESWLKERLDAVEAGERFMWGDTASPILERLAAAREDIVALTPAEALTAAIQASDLHRILLGWNEATRLTDHRLANIQRLKELASEYQEHCLAQHLAGTTSGFILWLRAMEQDFADDQAPNPGNAVTISTYHGAKGLEWPIVVCAGLDKDVKVSLFGTRVIASAAAFDWDAPLAGRELRYWPNPFPAQQGKDPLTQRLMQTAAWSNAEQQAKSEAIQLLYVGMTRARDQLVLTEEPRNPVGKWLGLLDSPLLPINSGPVMLPCGNQLEAECITLNDPGPRGPIALRPRHWLPPCSTPVTGNTSYACPPSSMEPLPHAICSVVHDFGTRITLHGNPDMESLGLALHHCLALTLTNPMIDRSVISTLLRHYPSVILDSDQIIQRSIDLRDWISSRYPGAKIHCELPFSRHLTNGQLQSGQIDLAVELTDRWILIDHKSNPEPKSRWPDIAARHSGQLSAYGHALTELSGRPVTETLIHFSVSGGIVEVAE